MTTGVVPHDAFTSLGPGTRGSTITGTAAAVGSPASAAGESSLSNYESRIMLASRSNL